MRRYAKRLVMAKRGSSVVTYLMELLNMRTAGTWQHRCLAKWLHCLANVGVIEHPCA
jgi:hypothetical protein